MKECIQKDKCIYDQGKSRQDLHKSWIKGKLKDTHEKRKKGFKSHDNKHGLYNYFKQPTLKDESRMKKSTMKKKPLQVRCWKCGGYLYSINVLRGKI